MLQAISKHRFVFFLGIIVFLLMYCFFAIVYPVYPYDADDWTYLHNWRDIYPSIEKYNPTRILPEILMPFCGEFSMLVIYPLVHNITISVCIASSLILSISITAYILLFYNLLRKEFQLHKFDSAFISLVFLIFHFFFFLKNDTENQHLFYSFDLCCHFNYTIPNIIASCFVLLFITKKFENIKLSGSSLKLSFLFIGLYLIIFSHVFSSIILVVYLGIYLLFAFIEFQKTNNKLSLFFKRFALHIFIIVLWLVVLLFEANGSRANAVQSIDPTPFSESFIQASTNMAYMFLHQTNLFAVFFIILSFFLFFTLTYKNKSFFYIRKIIYILLVSAFVSSIYLVLMAAATYPYYLLRLMTLYATPFFILLASFICIGALIKRCRSFIFILPIIMLVFGFTQHNGSTYQDIQTLYIEQDIQGTYKISPQDILKQNDHNIQYLIDADIEGISKPNLIVPKFNHYENWPLASYYAYRLARFLYKFGFLSAPLRATISTDELEIENSLENGRNK